MYEAALVLKDVVDSQLVEWRCSRMEGCVTSLPRIQWQNPRLKRQLNEGPAMLHVSIPGGTEHIYVVEGRKQYVVKIRARKNTL